MRRSRTWGIVAAVVAVAAAVAAAAAVAGTAGSTAKAKKPIIIGAAIDQTKQMKPYDTAAVRAAQLEAAKTKVNGRQFRVIVCNTQLDNDKARACAQSLLAKGAIAILVTCDVEYGAAATQVAINAGKLALGSCIGTDEQGPKRFGAKGRLAFSFGNVAQDEGAAMAEYAYKVKKWRTAITVTDNLLVYFKDVIKAFTARYKALGGRIVAADSFTAFQNQVPNVVNRIRTQRAQVIVTAEAFETGQLVQGLRSLRVNTPILNSWAGDGTNWYPSNPRVTRYWYVTFASIFGDDPNAAVRRLYTRIKASQGAPATGSFVTGATAIDALATAIKRAKGSTKGLVLAKQFERFKKLPTISGKISFSPRFHTVFGRSYRVIEVENNRGKYVGRISVKKPANIG